MLVLTSLLLLLWSALLCSADARVRTKLTKQLPPGEVFVQDADYNAGRYGYYVTQTFKSTNVTAPRVNMQKPFTDCDDGSFLFVTPRGEVPETPTAAILDASGSLIWTPNAYFGQVYNFQVQQYKGESFLTFWGGNDSVGGHGSGHYYMYDQNYRLVRKISAVNGLGADLHSFTILPNGNVLCTVYEKVPVDPQVIFGRKKEAFTFMWDSLFQEFSLETGQLVFQWRASEFLPLDLSYADKRPATSKEPWDWSHINMVEKDAAGNYLVSLRHLRCVVYVSGSTGEVLWKLGGKDSSFTDLSDGEASRMVGQHDAHWDEGQRFITFFDNRADWAFELEHVSKGRRLEVNLKEMTVKVNATFVHPQNIFAFSQGSYQTLPNGNVLLGYGYSAAMTEFAPNGTVLCDAYLQPSSRFSSGDVQSYRNLKFNWTGAPLTPPDVLLEGNSLFVSWLGSTKVRSWAFQDSFFEDGRFGPVLYAEKTGFETQIKLPSHLPLRQYLRIIALDEHDQELAASSVIDFGANATRWPTEEEVAAHEAGTDLLEADEDDRIEDETESDHGYEDVEVLLGFAFFVVVCAAVMLWVYRTRGVVGWWSNASTASSPLAFMTDQGIQFPIWQRLRRFGTSKFSHPAHDNTAYDLLPTHDRSGD
ncbi:hypothetical protein HII31_06652 [Pseudocercospora fuligena]|uniref:ASST-domain-containing protein n=1 Tax=Pseudocercospora fuligena TaxID=685502 RepID=A0A8H6RK25_9PEZI|nr:hypothetical protein HII31_06652 [Pseudocercospora fuligena]